MPGIGALFAGITDLLGGTAVADVAAPLATDAFAAATPEELAAAEGATLLSPIDRKSVV